MSSGARLGLAVAAGYLLGRFHKMKWALAIATMAGRGRLLPGGPGGVIQQGAKLLTSSPEFTKLTDEMRGQLVEAGKAAAVAAVSSKMNSLSEGLRERSDAMRAASAGGIGGGAAGEEEDERYRDRDERYRDEDRAAGSRPERGEEDGGRVPPQRREEPRSESDRARASRQSRSREGSAAHGRAGHSPRRGGDEDSARSGVGTGRGQDGGQSGRRSSASRAGGDSE